MFTRLIHSDYDFESSRFCRHGYLHENCSTCENEDNYDIDKCLNCGRYRASSSLNRDQVCIKRCTNPNEY